MIVLAIVTLLSGCFYKGVKVGDIKFKATEICSKEYALTYFNVLEHPTLGCLPPQRFESVSDFNFTLRRPPITLEESKDINKEAQRVELKNLSIVAPKSNHNLAPTFIGRIVEFKTFEDKEIKLPKSGNFTYPPIPNFDIKQIPSTVLLSSQVSANEDVKKQMAAKINVGDLVNTYLNLQYPNLPTKLIDALKDVVAKYESETDIQRLSLGKFQYVSIDENYLDQTIQVLQSRCLTVRDEKGTGVKDNASCVPAPFKDFASIDQNVVNYISSIESLMHENKKRRGDVAFALIIGASILNTSGDTLSCEKESFGAGSKPSDLDVSSCNTLQGRIKLKIDEVNNNPSKFDVEPIDAKNLLQTSKDSISTNIASAFFSRKKATLKTLKLDDHASVLAIHYILLQPGQVK